jgi:hypothetical protein
MATLTLVRATVIPGTTFSVNVWTIVNLVAANAIFTLKATSFVPSATFPDFVVVYSGVVRIGGGNARTGLSGLDSSGPFQISYSWLSVKSFHCFSRCFLLGNGFRAMIRYTLEDSICGAPTPDCKVSLSVFLTPPATLNHFDWRRTAQRYIR